MKNINIKIFITDRKDEKIVLSKEEIEELLNEAYIQGYNDRVKEQISTIPTTPMPSPPITPIITC